MASLADIEHEISNIMDVADEELTEEQQLAIEAYMAELGQAEADKVDSFARFIKIESARAKAVREEAQRLAAKAKAAENKIAHMKEHYLFILTQNNLEKVKGDAYTISIRNTKSVQVNEDALDSLPSEYKKVTVEARKTEIKKALEAGQQLAGCSIVENQSLNIR